jgi:hypothetical protein
MCGTHELINTLPMTARPSALTLIHEYGRPILTIVTVLNGGLHPTRPQRKICLYNILNSYNKTQKAQSPLRATTQTQSQTNDEW